MSGDQNTACWWNENHVIKLAEREWGQKGWSEGRGGGVGEGVRESVREGRIRSWRGSVVHVAMGIKEGAMEQT